MFRILKVCGSYSALAIALTAVLSGCRGQDQEVPKIEGPGRAPSSIQASDDKLAGAARTIADKAGQTAPQRQILFGDLHVHTTYSIDAFSVELPIMGGQGIHTPPDACDFARYCSGLDFFSFNDHAEFMTPEHWQVTKDTVRQCNALADDQDNPDLVVYTGFEWTNVGLSANKHWGHRNVIFPNTSDAELPVRPISSRYRGSTVGNQDSLPQLVKLKYLDPLNWARYADLGWLLDRTDEMLDCPRDVPAAELPPNCNEVADDPSELFAKLNSSGLDHLVIPHGNAWGMYTPIGASWDKALTRKQHNADSERLLEVMSGHGNSEEYRPWRHISYDENGTSYCPEPTEDFTACCWQAGEIMRRRCGDLPESECQTRIELAKQYSLESGAYANGVFPDAKPGDWLNCGQCTDCFKPAFGLRPKESSQYAMAISNFDQPQNDGKPLRFKYGFIASTDDHTARPGTGYKQYERRKMTFASGARSSFYNKLMTKSMDDPQMPQQVNLADGTPDSERAGSFSFPGGIVAVHSDSRRREDIWSALKNRRVYGTSGPRMLLWFDLLNAPQGNASMGAEVSMDSTPQFQVRALGDFVQQPGCPASSYSALSPARHESLCAGECYNPGDERHALTAIEVIKITPQMVRGEKVDALIEDPWGRFECPVDPEGCVAEFSDPNFNRDSLYYVRALQESTQAINGAYLREQRNASGKVISVNPCYGSYLTEFDDNCEAATNERAWSSPIFVNYLAPDATIEETKTP
ncbi:MAG: DUF3604 domain-containing protein [Halioglobus sp.]